MIFISKYSINYSDLKFVLWNNYMKLIREIKTFSYASIEVSQRNSLCVESIVE